MASESSSENSVWIAPSRRSLEWRVGIVSVLAVLALGVTGFGTRSIVQEQSRRLLSNELETVLKVDVVALRIWFESQEKSAQGAAQDMQAEDIIQALVRLAHVPETEETRQELEQALDQLRNELEPTLRTQEFDGFVIVDDHGHLVASDRDELIDNHDFPLQPGLLDKVFKQRMPTVTRPFKSVVPLMTNFSTPRTGVPTMFVFAPVYSEDDDEVMAALGLRINPHMEFVNILNTARAGKTGETYVFDKQGLLLSQSRFDDQLKEIGLIENTPDTTSMLNLYLRDPKADLLEGEASPLPAEERPLTKSVADAVAGNTGSDMSGYRDYRGVPVVGAWTWLDDYGIGVGTELDQMEAAATFHLLKIVFRSLFALFALSSIGIVIFTLRTGRLRQKSQSDARQFAVLLAGERAQALADIRSRSEFLARLGSDIRTPLHSMMQMTELTIETDLSLQQRQYLSTALTSARSLEQVLNEILDLNQVEAGQLELHREAFLFRETLSDVIGPITIQAKVEGKTVSCEVADDLPDGMYGDVERVRQVIKNMATRSIELAGPEGIEINVAAGERSEEEVEVVFRVAVKGNRAAGRSFKSILKDFRNPESLSGKRSRSDLAVAVAARLLEFAGGRVWVEDEEGDDPKVCFSSTVETRDVDEQLAHRTDLGLIPGLPVLVVDENDDTRDALEQMLKHADMAPTSISDGARLLPTLDEARNQGSPFGLVIIDAEIGGEEDGFSLCSRIKQNQAHAAIPVILAISAERTEQVEMASDSGASGHVLKPVKSTVLEGAIVTAVLGRGRYQQLRNDLDAAESYVRSLIPAPVDEPLKIDWRYVPASELAGDALGFHWIDDDHCAFYVIDASGHGIDACLRSVSILDAVKSQSLPETDFRRPDEVLAQLNRRFPMDAHDDQCFSMWYGVLRKTDMTLAWAGGGHPPSLLLTPGEGGAEFLELPSTGPMLGMLPESRFAERTHAVREGQQLYIYSDGVFEIEKPDGVLWTFEEFTAYFSALDPNEGSRLDLTWQHVHALSGQQVLEDDFTIVEVSF